MTVDVRVFGTPTNVARAAAALFVRSAVDAINARGRFTVALSGGSAPLPLYRLLGQPPLFNEVGADRWRSIHLFWGDERCVPLSDERSNTSAALNTLGDVATLAQVHVIEVDETPERASELYEEELQATLDGDVIDLVLLGIGSDGHTASLFPGSPALDVKDRAVVAVDAPQHIGPHVPRVTFTLETINGAQRVVFIVIGSSKAEITRQVLDQIDRDEVNPLPAARVRPEGELIWMLDRDAADT